MKAILFCLAVILLPAVLAWAQGDEPDPFCYCVRDNSCNGSTSGESFTFTTTSATNVYFRCWGLCNNGADPFDCRVTVTLVQAGIANPVAMCDNWNSEDCGDPSYGPTTASLQANTQYTITAILQSCGATCCGNCRAVGMVWEKDATCPAP